MRFGVLGPLAVWTNEGHAVSIPGAKVRGLLAHLLVSSGDPVSADRLLEELWHGEPPPDGAAAVQTAVSRLRRALDRAEPGTRALVESGPSGYRLRAGRDAVDATRFDDLLATARSADSPRETAALLTEALDLWRGPALADHADMAFAAASVARWEDQRALALETRAEARLALGEHASLIGELDELVRHYPLREGLRATHMRALYRAGRQAEALESYQRARAVLAEEVGVDPSPELARLHQAMLERSPELAAPEPAVSAPETREEPQAPPGNLPAALTTLVGRDSAGDDVRVLLDEARLVTLTGPGGVGKTALAVSAVGPADPRRFPDGTWMVELAGARHTLESVDDLAESVASILGVRDDVAAGRVPSRHTSTDRLARGVRDWRALLVVDNCEHVAGPIGELLTTLLRAAPGLRVLATSREPLGAPGERLYQVPPLEAPTRDALVEVRRSPAAQLFARRAAASVPGFAVDASNAAAVAEICRRLDGLPLALELAAARLRALSVRELAERLDDRFRLLTAGGTGMPARQRTLRAVIDWSWELLPATEQVVLRRLSTHAGGFTLAAAEAVCGGDGVEAAGVVESLARLVDRSLVVAETTPLGTRYRMLESVAAFARERLTEAGEAANARGRHARYYVDLAEDSDRRLRGPKQVEALERIDVEGANLRTALDWAREQGDTDLALRLTGALSWYWYLRGRHVKGRDRLATALASPGPCRAALWARARVWHAVLGLLVDAADHTLMEAANEALALYGRLEEPAGLAEAQVALALLATTAKGTGHGRLPTAESMAESAAETFRGLGDDWGLAAALLARGWAGMRRGDLTAASADAHHSNALFHEVGDRWGQVRSSTLLGVLAEIFGRYEEARLLHGNGLACAEEIGFAPTAAEEMVRLARLFLLSRDFAAADRYNEEVLRRTGESSFSSVATYARGGLGMSARRQGNLDRAEEYLGDTLAVHTAEDYQAGRASMLAELGFAAEMRGDAAQARALHLDGLAASHTVGDPRAIAQALEGVAGADVLDGVPDRAARLLGAASAARSSAGAPQPAAERFDVDRVTAGVVRELGDERFAAEFHVGERTELVQAAREASLTGERRPAPEV
ncbi:BTAD domain-containing putative transcriptional regulator [Halostreptopolyspora alba]|uniref:AfsR/SARP family transcriptional regulator n=1 Tax=Halostreptopolyspora alba TaxID=2487137 RepID=A0A3N0E2S9_9ACTN|nr:AfsR/SARP family transcriptional regulator [Nocardiopsaceae bacterium YIM 96095]